MLDLQALNRESLVQLTVIGRKSGKPHTVKIWFATDVSKGKVYVTSARGSDAQWVKNLRKTPQVTLQIGNTSFKGSATWREDDGVQTEVLPLFLHKYFLARVFKWIGWYKTIFAFEITPEK
jgi:deazaflavin-dependent oxidoreductase (nitroreductase family)